jgi:diguanylate cyclase (GGDEF)-like protein
MSARSVKAGFSDLLGCSIPDRAFHFDLVRALYSTPKSIFSAAIAALAVVAVTGALSGDRSYGLLFLGFLIVGAGRSALVVLYGRARHDPEDIGSVRGWELGALIGAWSFAGLVGITGSYTLLAHPGTESEILINCCVMGYIAGISSRNASRPLITIGQISFTCIPFLLALLLRMDLVHTALAAFIAVLYVSTVFICRTVYDNIVARHDAFAKVETLAKQDALTQLWNRAAFLQLLQQQLDSDNGAGGVLALVAIDLDRFKDINDTLGHLAGDGVLREASGRIRTAVRSGDHIARIGGDEFLVMLRRASPEEVEEVALDILARFARPFVIDFTSNDCGASIGYAISPGNGATLESLMRYADLALYEAKKRGRGQVVPYSPALSQIYDNRVALEHDLRLALDQGQLEIEYQPIVDPRSGRAICCEALLRWRHPRRGTIAPSEFIPIAEATGLIVPIGTWVLAAACAEAMRWSTDIKVSVNLSPMQFRRGREIVDVVMGALDRSGLPPWRLDLEVTESVLIEDGDATLAILQELRERGIGVSLDDFGTGFSSLAYLNDFPFSKIKIDRVFSSNIDQSPRTSAIIRGITQITKDLRMELVAEGVETEVQLDHIRSFGINAIQGYLYSKPLKVQQLRRLIVAPIAPILPAAHPQTRPRMREAFLRAVH